MSKNQKFDDIIRKSQIQLERNLEASGATSLDGKDSLSGFLLLPLCMLAMLMMSTGIAFAVKRWYKIDIMKKLLDLKKKMLWNDVITPFNLSYFTNCIVFLMLVELRGTKSASFVSVVLAMIIFVQPVVCFVILRKYSTRDLILVQNRKF